MFEKLNIEDAFIFTCHTQTDYRGSFFKIFSDEVKDKFSFNVCESYYSISNKNVIRGMHFQVPPFHHSKIVKVIKGSILDVFIDLRKSSNTYRNIVSIKLKNDSKSLYIPAGCAHGFKSLENDTIVIYYQNSIYSSDYDKGVLWNSLEFDWSITTPIVSKRDSKFPKINDYKSPFK